MADKTRIHTMSAKGPDGILHPPHDTRGCSVDTCGWPTAPGIGASDYDNKILTFTVMNRLSVSELNNMLQSVANLYPVQFIISLNVIYDERANTSRIIMETNGEKFKGQMIR